MSLTVCNGTAIAMMLRMQPEPKSKKNRLPLPSSTMMQVPAWSPRRDRGAADEGDPHLVGAELLRARVVDVVADEVWRRPVVRRQRDPAARHAAVGVCAVCSISVRQSLLSSSFASQGNSHTVVTNPSSPPLLHYSFLVCACPYALVVRSVFLSSGVSFPSPLLPGRRCGQIEALDL